MADIDFDSGARVEYPPRDWGLDEPLTANEMVEKLKASPYFDGFSDNFLWGMVSNSQYESGHIVNNAGDPESKIGKRKFEPVRKFCSFGYWQLNLCSGDGQGTSFLEVEAVKKLFKKDKDYLETIKLYEMLRKLEDLRQERIGEFRKNVCLKIYYQGEEIQVNLEQLKIYADQLEKFISTTKQFLLS